MNKNKITSVLAFVIFLSGAGATVSADSVSVCEYWHGDPIWTCGFAFIYSEAGQSSCKMQFPSGFPNWSDRDLNSLDPDNLTDSQRNKLAKMKETWGGACQCNVKIKCGWVKVSSNGWIAVPSPQTSYHECSVTPDALGTMRYHQGQLTPSC
ncbi:MAG: hypothetical protein OXE41_07960 [Gammaproteobacteria bacterium]|nr:hypothetical protein [Gammaproteobacteria bacterium]MCY4219525.1 hypothetical protein [Gammaproteobacteria bacterium]MCY4275311.1 hypothetical protein [Gammaproteobacteria bacterium]